MKITGSKAYVFFGGFDAAAVISGAGAQTEAGKWYRILEKGEGSDLPLERGFPFRAPAAGNGQITLVMGDRIAPLDPARFCKTSANINAEEGTVEAGDDCDPGATILDGIVKFSGSLAGFFRYDDETNQFDDVTDGILNRFFDVVNDDAAGIYEYKKSKNDAAYLLCCLNSGAAIGQTENWAYLPVIISSAGINLGNSDVQNKDLSWTKGEGPAVIYKRARTE